MGSRINKMSYMILASICPNCLVLGYQYNKTFFFFNKLKIMIKLNQVKIFLYVFPSLQSGLHNPVATGVVASTLPLIA